ncbi:MAG: hypothetical protein ACTSQO_12180 [Candidatus Helarchaeota archaeon]
MVQSKLIIKIEGDEIKDRRISIGFLGRLMTHTQQLIYNFAKISLGKKFKENFIQSKFNFLLDTIKPGSIQLVLIPEDKQTRLDGKLFVDDAIEKMIRILDIVEIEKEDIAFKNFKKSIPNKKFRIRILNNLQYIWSNSNTTLMYQYYNRNGNIFSKRLSHFYYKRFHDWLEKEIPKPIDIYIRGIITRIKLDPPKKYFTIITEDNKVVRCYFPDNLEYEIIDYILKPVEISGQYKKKGRGSEITEINDIKLYENLILDNLYDLEFKIPLEFKIDYQDDFWIAENKELNLYCWGETFKALKKSIYDDLLYIKDFIMYEKDEKLSKKAKEIKYLLLKIFGE